MKGVFLEDFLFLLPEPKTVVILLLLRSEIKGEILVLSFVSKLFRPRAYMSFITRPKLVLLKSCSYGREYQPQVPELLIF